MCLCLQMGTLHDSGASDSRISKLLLIAQKKELGVCCGRSEKRCPCLVCKPGGNGSVHGSSFSYQFLCHVFNCAGEHAANILWDVYANPFSDYEGGRIRIPFDCFKVSGSDYLNVYAVPKVDGTGDGTLDYGPEHFMFIMIPPQASSQDSSCLPSDFDFFEWKMCAQRNSRLKAYSPKRPSATEKKSPHGKAAYHALFGNIACPGPRDWGTPARSVVVNGVKRGVWNQLHYWDSNKLDYYGNKLKDPYVSKKRRASDLADPSDPTDPIEDSDSGSGSASASASASDSGSGSGSDRD